MSGLQGRNYLLPRYGWEGVEELINAVVSFEEID
jgi:hypothetical protein